MAFVLSALVIVFLLCLWGCIYFAWKLYISRNSEHYLAVVDEIIKETSSARPIGWRYKANIHITFQGEKIQKKLFFFARERINLEEDYHIPVLVNISKRGKINIYIEDSKSLLIFVILSCGFGMGMFGLVIGLVLSTIL